MYTFTSPVAVQAQTVAAVNAASIRIVSAVPNFASQAAQVSFEYLDASGNVINPVGSPTAVMISGSEFTTLWNAGVTLKALYTALATALGLPAGTAAGDGSLN